MTEAPFRSDQPPLETVAGVVLMGGRSTRFGSDKATAVLHRRPLVEWVATELAWACREIVVVHAPGQKVPPLTLAVPLVLAEDLYPGQGPLGGIVTGFAATGASLAFVVSCDAPLVRPALVYYLASLADGYDIVLPIAHRFPQPLVALYRVAACLPRFRESIEGGNLKITQAFRDLRLRRVDEPDIRTIDPELDSFRNVNDRDTLAEIEARLGSGMT